MPRHVLSDQCWKTIVEFLPKPGGTGGRPWKDHRRTLDGILWILKTGAPWRDLPEHFGSWSTVYKRFNRWSKDGTFDAIVEALQAKLDAAGELEQRLALGKKGSARA